LNVLFRFEANMTKGWGHANRCLGLAQALIEGGHLVKALCLESVERGLRAWIDEQSADGRMDLILRPDAAGADRGGRETLRVASDFGADWLVADDYALDDEYFSVIQGAIPRVLTFSDDKVATGRGDIVLNQNFISGESRRTLRDGAVVLEGVDFFLCRRAVLEKRARRETGQPGTAVLVSLGGADRDNIGLAVCRELVQSRDFALDVDLACTGGEEGLREARALARTFPRLRVHDRPDLIRLIDESGCHQISVSAGGVTSLELGCLGMASVLLVTADNQAAGAEAFADKGAAVLKTDPRTAAQAVLDFVHDDALRRRYSGRAMALIDGNGAQRVAAEMTALSTKH
jgi:spore coat polysaccharide biosynthesis predicted glycosyltransferase SpsG